MDNHYISIADQPPPWASLGLAELVQRHSKVKGRSWLRPGLVTICHGWKVTPTCCGNLWEIYGKYGDLWEIPSSFIKRGKLGNPVKLGVSIGKSPIHNHRQCISSIAMFDYRSVNMDWIGLSRYFCIPYIPDIQHFIDDGANYVSTQKSPAFTIVSGGCLISAEGIEYGSRHCLVFR